MRHRELRIAQRTANAQAVGLQLCRARIAHQESDIDPGLRQTPAEIATGAAGAEDQDTHRHRHQLRKPTPRRSSHSASALSTATKPSISA